MGVCQGIGIRPEDQSKLFQNFQRSDMQKKYDVTGLGFVSECVQILVEAHSGYIWVESTLGEGSTFYFTLLLACARA